jgi:uncharacterized protein
MEMNCPVCSTELRMTERQGVEIDYCPQCRGVWLDRGELDKIIDRSAAEPPQDERVEHRPPPREYEQREYRSSEYRHDPRYKKKKSFLGDLFDF